MGVYIPLVNAITDYITNSHRIIVHQLITADDTFYFGVT
jgi:hypothetical protein